MTEARSEMKRVVAFAYFVMSVVIAFGGAPAPSNPDTPYKQSAASKGGTLTYTGTDVTCAQVKDAIRKFGLKPTGKNYVLKCHDEVPPKPKRSN